MTPLFLETKFYIIIPATGALGFFIGYLLYPLTLYIPQYLIQPSNVVGETPLTYNRLSFSLLNMAISMMIVGYFGLGAKTLTNLFLAYGLLLLAYIDFKHYLLPDCLTLPVLWLGLFCNSFNLFVLTSQAIWGAIVGYSSLRIIAALFKYLRGVDGIGQGDMKLFALFGAWWGISPLIFIIMTSSLLGILGTLVQMAWKKHSAQSPIPFGPYMVFSGFLVMFFRDYLRWFPCLSLD